MTDGEKSENPFSLPKYRDLTDEEKKFKAKVEAEKGGKDWYTANNPRATCTDMTPFTFSLILISFCKLIHV